MTARSTVEAAFSELEMLKLWRGLYMCMWHSDKPLVQEELAENLASFVHVLVRREVVFLFIKSFFSIMSREWLSIDRLRLDKFYMLIRRMIRHSFQFLLDNEWDRGLVNSLVQLLSDGPLNPDLSKVCSGVQLHVVEVYLPELLTVGANSVPAECSLLLLQPCCHLLANTRDPVTVQVIEANVLGQLVVGRKAEKLKVDVCVMSERLLQLAVSRDTLGRNRKTLYTLRQR
jgi:ribosomal RNA-processing protein 1